MNVVDNDKLRSDNYIAPSEGTQIILEIGTNRLHKVYMTLEALNVVIQCTRALRLIMK